jgi:hypothetical protein
MRPVFEDRWKKSARIEAPKKFPKTFGPPPSSRHQNGDMNEIPY